MRRKDRQITDEIKIIDIVKRCAYVNVAFLDGDTPYVVPLNFGLLIENGVKTLYFHGAGEGKKLDLLSKNSHVAFSMVADNILQAGDSACSYTMKYASVCGSGIASLVTEDEKPKALAAVMKQYAPEKDFSFPAPALEGVSLWKIEITAWCGKSNITGMAKSEDE